MSKEVRVGSLAEVNDIVEGDEYAESDGLLVIITGVDSLRHAPGMLSQLGDMVDSNHWCIEDKAWLNRVAEIGTIMSGISLCLQQLGQNIQEGISVTAVLHHLREFQTAVEHIREGPLPPEITKGLRRLRTLLDRPFSSSEPIFQPADLQQQGQQLVGQLMGTALVCPAFEDDPRVEFFSFEEDTKQLLDLLSSETPRLSDFQKKLFLDELLSNCCNSLDMVKLRKDSTFSPPLFIEIILNKEKNTFTIRDTGIGMTRSDLIDKLSKAACPRAKDFTKFADDGITKTNQMGIGFFSSYYIANKVVVSTKNDSDEQYIWEPRSNTTYTVSPNNGGKSLDRGTMVTLYLKPDQRKYLDLHHVTEHVKKCVTLFDHEVYFVVENCSDVPEAGDDLELVSALTPGRKTYRFRLVKDKPLVHKRNNEDGEPEQRKKRKVQVQQ